MKRLLGIVALALVAAKQNLCASLDDFAASVVALQGVGLSSSQDQLKSAVIAGLEPKLSAFAQAWKQFAVSLDCKTTS